MLKGQKGITLVALIITIIVLIILAGVSITIALGENGIFQKSKNAVNYYKEQEGIERNTLNATDEYLQNTMNEYWN